MMQNVMPIAGFASRWVELAEEWRGSEAWNTNR